MTEFALDCSVTMAWCFEDEATSFTGRVLDRLTKAKAYVPVIWPLEVVNVLLVAERKKRLNEAQSLRFLELVGSLPISVDGEEAKTRVFKETFSLARQFALSSYDAAYLELAIRRGIPLATKDTKLRKAAQNCGVKILS